MVSRNEPCFSHCDWCRTARWGHDASDEFGPHRGVPVVDLRRWARSASGSFWSTVIGIVLCVESRNIHGSRLLPYSHLLIMSLKQNLSGKSLSKKYEITQLFKNGVKRAKIAKDLDIPSSTVYDLCKNVDRVIAEYHHQKFKRSFACHRWWWYLWCNTDGTVCAVFR